VRGADNLISASISGATAPVAAPTLSTPSAPPPPTSAVSEGLVNPQAQDAKSRSGLLTVELLGLGPEGGTAPEDCKDDDKREECRQAKRK
jgi:hypothetical protein